MPRAWLVLAGTLLAAYASSALATSWEAGDFVFSTILLVVPWIAGLGMRRWRSRAHELEELTVQLEASRTEHAQLLLDVERLRIARDLHDSIAQTLNAVVVHAQVAEAALDTDPGVAKHSLDRIVEVSRRSLSEIRDLLGTLRGHDQHAEPPRLEDVARMVERFRADGMRIELRDTGAAGAGGTAVDATLARILHEALTNAGQARTGRTCDGDGRAGRRHRPGGSQRGGCRAGRRTPAARYGLDRHARTGAPGRRRAGRRPRTIGRVRGRVRGCRWTVSA